MTGEDRRFVTDTRRHLFGRAVLGTVSVAGLIGAASMVGADRSLTPAFAAPPSTGEEPAIDKWLRTKVADIGMSFDFPPVTFKDPKTGAPNGMQVEINKLMFADLGVKINYVEVPYPQSYAAQQAGKFDMSGISGVNLPTRATRVLFAGFPTFYESTVIVLKPGSAIRTQSGLNDPKVKIALQQGSAQEYTARVLFPKATIQTFTEMTQISAEVASGRADATTFSEFNLAETFKAYPNVKLLPGNPVVYLDADYYYMRPGDYKTHAWVTNWLRYQAAHGVLGGLYSKWIGNDLRAQFKFATPVVGAGGEGLAVDGAGRQITF